VGNRWLILAALFTVRIVTGILYQTVGSLAPYLVNDLGIDYTQLGTLNGLSDRPGIFLAIPGALLGKRFGDKRVVMAALALMGCGGLLMGLGGSYAVVASGRLLSGVGGAMLNVLLVKMAIDWFAGREMVTAMALLMSSWPLGISLGLVILAPLATATSWQMAMALTAAMCVASLLLVIITYRPAPNAVSGETSGGTRRWLGMRELGLVGLAATIWALLNSGFVSLPSFGPAFLTSTGYTVAGAGALVSIAIWISIPSVQVGGYLADRLGRPNLVMLSCFIAGGLVMALLPSMPEQIALFVAFGLIIGVPAGNIMALAPSILRPQDRATGWVSSIRATTAYRRPRRHWQDGRAT
jgi:MFS family permease